MPRLYVIECCACSVRHELQFRGGAPAGGALGWACITVHDPNLPRHPPGVFDDDPSVPVEYLCDKCVKERLPERIAAMIADAEANTVVAALAGGPTAVGVGRKRGGYRLAPLLRAPV